MTNSSKTDFNLAQLVENLQGGLAGDAGATILRQRLDAMVIRLKHGDDQSVVAKLWMRSGMRRWARRITGTSSVHREWHALQALFAAGVAVPCPLGYSRLSSSRFSFTDVLFLQDLGDCKSALDYIKPLIREKRWSEVESIESQLIDLTSNLVKAGIIDTDHGLPNIVVDATGKAYRIDLELARQVPSIMLASRPLGIMMGRMIATYAFALQPDAERVLDFADRLSCSINPSRRVRAHAKEFIGAMLRRQIEQRGIHTNVQLPW